MASSSSSHARLPRPLSDHLANSSSSPRVRFNLEPMHFEFSDVEDDDQMAFKLRDRSPSDPLISLEETIDLRRYVYSSTFKSTFISKGGLGWCWGTNLLTGTFHLSTSQFSKKKFLLLLLTLPPVRPSVRAPTPDKITHTWHPKWYSRNMTKSSQSVTMECRERQQTHKRYFCQSLIIMCLDLKGREMRGRGRGTPHLLVLSFLVDWCQSIWRGDSYNCWPISWSLFPDRKGLKLMVEWVLHKTDLTFLTPQEKLLPFWLWK